MNKAKLIEQMAKVTKMQKATCELCLKAFMNIICTTLKQNKSVVLTGFGTFSVMQRKKRKGINPATGKPMDIPARKVPKFKPGKAFKDMID
jgi:DNA-binding protein HU-beta